MRQFDGAEARLIALTAATAAHRAASRAEAQALIEHVDWNALAHDLGERRLLALLGERIIEVADRLAPDSFRQATRAAISAGGEQQSWLELISIHVAGALRAAGISSLPLKGPLLGHAIYGKPGRRFSSDIDVLVSREDLFAAAEVVQRLGYRPLEDPAPLDELPRLHLRMGQPGMPPLELHWRVHWYEWRFSRDMLARSSEVRGALRRATPVDELTSLLLFYARDGFLGLRLASDLAAWWDTHSSQVEDGALEEQMRGYPELERAVVAAAHVADRVVKLPSGRLLRTPRRLQARVRFAISLKNPDVLGGSQQQAAEQHLVDLLLAPDGAARDAVGRQLHDAGHAQGRTGLRRGLTSLTTIARLSLRYALSLVRVVLAGRRQGPRATA